MAKLQASIVVEQYNNPRFDDGKPVDDDNCPYTYCVAKTTNSLEVAIGEWLTKKQVLALIKGGIYVTVNNKR